MSVLKKILPVFVAVFFLFSCDNRKEVEDMTANTMQIHDEAMAALGPMMSESRRLKKLLAIADSTSLRADSLKNALMSIDKAEADMMDWMQHYKAPKKETPKAEALKYLEAEKAKIEQNFADIKAATEGAKKMN